MLSPGNRCPEACRRGLELRHGSGVSIEGDEPDLLPSTVLKGVGNRPYIASTCRLPLRAVANGATITGNDLINHLLGT